MIFLITNNGRIKELYGAVFEVWLKETYVDVLMSARDSLHQGAVLLTHPMAGSLKPNQTPFKTVILECKGADSVDFKSLALIENAIDTFYKFMACHRLPAWGDKTTEDFKTLDVSFMEHAIQRLLRYV